MEESLGLRLCRLCALPSGQLPGLRFHDHGARAAMLIDLVLLRRISLTAARELHVVAAPTGLVAHDEVLAYVDRHRGVAPQKLLAKAPGRMKWFLPDVQSGGWRRPSRRRFTSNEMAAEHQRLDRAVAGDIDSPRTAALALLADALKLVVVPEPEGALGASGEAAWVVQECIQYLLLVRYRYELSVFAAGGGGG